MDWVVIGMLNAEVVRRCHIIGYPTPPLCHRFTLTLALSHQGRGDIHYRSASLGTRVRGYDGGYAERGKCHRASGTSCVLAALVPPLNLPLKGDGDGSLREGEGDRMNVCPTSAASRRS